MRANLAQIAPAWWPAHEIPLAYAILDIRALKKDTNFNAKSSARFAKCIRR
jgi:hypothetical protein